MSMNHVKQLSDGEELIEFDPRETFLEGRETFLEGVDPHEASVERRSRALSDTRGADASLRPGSPSSQHSAVE